MRSDEEEEHISYAAVMDRSARGLIPPIVLGVSGLGHFALMDVFLLLVSGGKILYPEKLKDSLESLLIYRANKEMIVPFSVRLSAQSWIKDATFLTFQR